MEDKTGSISTCWGVISNHCHKVSHYETGHKSMNLCLIPWITEPTTRPPALYVKLGIHHSLSLFLYWRMEAHTLKMGWILRSVATRAPWVSGCPLWSVLLRWNFFKLLALWISICHWNSKKPKYDTSAHLWKPGVESLLNHCAVLRSFPALGQQWQRWRVLWNICCCLRSGRKQFILSPVAVTRLTVTSVKWTCPNEIQKSPEQL